MSCPACGSAHVRDSQWHKGDAWYRRMVLTPQRCRDCRHRFWRPSARKLLLTGLAGLAVLAAVAFSGPPRHVSAPVTPQGAGVTTLATLKQNAERGDASAQLALGLRHLEGNGTLTDVAAAVPWFSKAARLGNREAQYKYGQALFLGRGVIQDYQAALRWLELAARAGHRDAQALLAEIYRFGRGTAASKSQAYLWYTLAAAQGDEVSAKARDFIASQMSPEALIAAQQEAKAINAKASAARP